jgi:hypothetical protein
MCNFWKLSLQFKPKISFFCTNLSVQNTRNFRHERTHNFIPGRAPLRDKIK